MNALVAVIQALFASPFAMAFGLALGGWWLHLRSVDQSRRHHLLVSGSVVQKPVTSAAAAASPLSPPSQPPTPFLLPSNVPAPSALSALPSVHSELGEAFLLVAQPNSVDSKASVDGGVAPAHVKPESVSAAPELRDGSIWYGGENLTALSHCPLAVSCQFIATAFPCNEWPSHLLFAARSTAVTFLFCL